MQVEITSYDDVALAADECGELVAADPVGCTAAATALAAALSSGIDARGVAVTTARVGGEIAGVAIRPAAGARTSLVSSNRMVATRLGRALASEAGTTSLDGEIRAVVACAGEWASATAQPIRVSSAQQLYELASLNAPPRDPTHAVRGATDDDVGLLCDWFAGFDEETFARGIEPEPLVRAKLPVLRVLEANGEPVAMAAASNPAHGVRRVHAVFTDRRHRQLGYGAAVTAAVTREIVNAGHRAVLFTDLANPTSNAIYRRLGYAAHSEFASIELG